MSPSTVYLDHAAATPLDERVFLAMQPYLSDCFYNPSAPYGGGREARAALQSARNQIAAQLGAKADDCVFTAGATESIYLGVQGTVPADGHIVLGALEHAAVRSAAGVYDTSIAPCDTRGAISPANVRSVIREDTILVSIAYADSEFGIIQPLSAIARMLEEVRAERKEKGNQTPLYFHSDASQAAAYLDIKVSRLGVDLLTLNAAKCYGPKQVGLLWVSPHVRLRSVLAGGGQERGLRGGTENVAGAVGFAMALRRAQSQRHAENERLQQIRQVLQDGLREQLPDLVIDGDSRRQLPGYIHAHSAGLDAERVVFHLDMKGVYVATGAACAANKGTRSPALEAFGLTPEEADGSIRFSLGKLNTLEQIREALPVIVEAVRTEQQL